MTYRSNKIKLATNNRKAFTFMEVVMAVVILAFVAASILAVMNQCIGAATDSRTRLQAFEIARENMEMLLAEDKLPEGSEFGISETNPDIQWETVIETFTEPTTTSMWLQAICSASYTDKDGQIQTVELTHWLSEVPEEIQKKIKEQKEKELEMMKEYGGQYALMMIEQEYKETLGKALGLDFDEIENLDIGILEEIAKDEGLDPYVYMPEPPTEVMLPKPDDTDGPIEPEEQVYQEQTYDPTKPTSIDNYRNVGELFQWMLEQRDKN